MRTFFILNYHLVKKLSIGQTKKKVSNKIHIILLFYTYNNNNNNNNKIRYTIDIAMFTTTIEKDNFLDKVFFPTFSVVLLKFNLKFLKLRELS